MKTHVKFLAAASGVILILVSVGLMLSRKSSEPRVTSSNEFYSSPVPVMDTLMSMTVVTKAQSDDKIKEFFKQAIGQTNIVAKHMNAYDDKSELGVLNRTKQGEAISVHPETVKVITTAREIYEQTDGAFDVTISPVIKLWKSCADNNRLPSDSELATARKASRWDHFEVNGNSVTKAVSSACMNLSGIAKGYAIDLAAESLVSNGCLGGLVEIGGDIRCFGSKPGNAPWRVAITNPFAEGDTIGTLAITNGAVCTSGNYRRAIVIQGKSYNHIFDPRDGRPCNDCVSSTVIASDATTADAWATALTVLGSKGLEMIEDTDIEAMIITGNTEDYLIEMTSGFEQYVCTKNKAFFK